MFTRTLLFLVLGASLFAQAPADRPGSRFQPQYDGFMPPMNLRGLELTEAQKTQIKALREQHRATLRPKLDAAGQAQRTLRGAMMDPAVSVEELRKLHGTASQAQFEVMLEHRAQFQEILALLTPEQKAKLESMRKDRPRNPRFPPGPMPPAAPKQTPKL